MTDTALPPGSARPRLSLRFSARDLVNVAMFAVLMIVVTYAIGMLGILSPLVWLAVVPVSVLVNGIVFMLFVTRVRHAGMVTLLGVVVALFYLLTGNTVFSSIGIIVLAVLAEVVLWGGGYRSRWAAIWAYTIFALSFFTPFLPLVFDREGYLTSPSFTRMGDEYVMRRRCADHAARARRPGGRGRRRRVPRRPARLRRSAQALCPQPSLA